jgi:hypothetical protein
MEEQRRRRRRIPTGGSSTRAEGQPLDIGEDDEMEGLMDLNEHVEDIPAQRARDPRAELENTPAARLSTVGGKANTYEREYRLKLLHRLLMRGIPLDIIANEMKVSVDTVIRDRQELGRRLRSQASSLDANTLIGETLAFYEETQSMAMKMASDRKIPTNSKLAAIRTALSSRNDRHRFLTASGVFDVLQYSPSENSNSSDLERLMELTHRLLADDQKVSHLAEENNISEDSMVTDDDEEEHEQDLRLF